MPVTFKSTGVNLGRKLQRLSADGKAVARTAIARELENLVQEGFDARVEPRGRAWEERKQDYPWPILEKTGRMRHSFAYNASGSNVTISNNATDGGREYALFHQFGWMQGGSRQAARQMMPISAMPARWTRRFDRVVFLALQGLR